MPVVSWGKEHEFDWDEVDEVYLKPEKATFILNNEECHVVPFDMLQSLETLRRAWQDARQQVKQKKITITEGQK